MASGGGELAVINAESRGQIISIVPDLNLTATLDYACEQGVPMHTVVTAMQLFHAGKTRYPDGDNWFVTRALEETVGAELHR